MAQEQDTPEGNDFPRPRRMMEVGGWIIGVPAAVAATIEIEHPENVEILTLSEADKTEAAEILARIDRGLTVEEARADRLLRHYGLV